MNQNSVTQLTGSMCLMCESNEKEAIASFETLSDEARANLGHVCELSTHNLDLHDIDYTPQNFSQSDPQPTTTHSLHLSQREHELNTSRTNDRGQ